MIITDNVLVFSCTYILTLQKATVNAKDKIFQT